MDAWQGETDVRAPGPGSPGCDRCGHRDPPGSSFCSSCGSSLTGPNGTGSDRATSGEPERETEPAARRQVMAGFSWIEKIVALCTAIVGLLLALPTVVGILPCEWRGSCPIEQLIEVTGYDGEAEWVELTNVGADPVDLTRWEVRDRAGHTYQFLGPVVPPGASVVLHTGHGDDTDTDVYWGRDDHVFDDGTEQVVVVSPDRCEVDSYVH